MIILKASPEVGLLVQEGLSKGINTGFYIAAYLFTLVGTIELHWKFAIITDTATIVDIFHIIRDHFTVEKLDLVQQQIDRWNSCIPRISEASEYIRDRNWPIQHRMNNFFKLKDIHIILSETSRVIHGLYLNFLNLEHILNQVSDFDVQSALRLMEPIRGPLVYLGSYVTILTRIVQEKMKGIFPTGEFEKMERLNGFEP